MIGTKLNGATFHRANLIRAALNGANLSKADLTHADLTGATLVGAYMSEAKLNDVKLIGSNLRGAYLRAAEFRGSDLRGTILENATAVKTDFSGANLSGCHIYGISAWDVSLEGTIQSNLLTTEREPHIQVDDLEVAQFIYLLLNRKKLRNVIMTLGEKGVLILGRFTERRELLDRISDKLRSLGYLPIIFDFERPTDRDLTETVKILAGLSLFVIADITNPRSVPLELQAIVPDYMVPFVTILQRDHPAFGMFTVDPIVKTIYSLQ